MKALTLTQPWATLCIAKRIDTGVPSKSVESRSWSTKAPQRIGLHAGKGIDRDVRESISDGIIFKQPFQNCLIAAGYSPFDPWNKSYGTITQRRVPHLRILSLGAMLAAVTIETVKRGSDVLRMIQNAELDAMEEFLGFYDERNGKRFGFFLADRLELRLPIPCRGFQQLWTIPDDVQRAMHAQGVK